MANPELTSLRRSLEEKLVDAVVAKDATELLERARHKPILEGNPPQDITEETTEL